MSKTIIAVLMAVALIFAIYNATLIDVGAPFQGNSLVACIGVLASLCAVVVLLIFYTSREIQKRVK